MADRRTIVIRRCIVTALARAAPQRARAGRTVLAATLDFLPLNLPSSLTAAGAGPPPAGGAAAATSATGVASGVAGSMAASTSGAPSAASASATASSDAPAATFSSSRRSRLAAAWMGMPVQWKAKGKRTRLPRRRWYTAANSALVTVKAWPRCSRPFMYGYGKVHMNLGGGAPPAYDAGGGASASKARSAAHSACTARSTARRWSRRTKDLGSAAGARPSAAGAAGGGAVLMTVEVDRQQRDTKTRPRARTLRASGRVLAGARAAVRVNGVAPARQQVSRMAACTLRSDVHACRGGRSTAHRRTARDAARPALDRWSMSQAANPHSPNAVPRSIAR